jgi:hypothetical protein
MKIVGISGGRRFSGAGKAGSREMKNASAARVTSNG